jgi:hypothetical protein
MLARVALGALTQLVWARGRLRRPVKLEVRLNEILALGLPLERPKCEFFSTVKLNMETNAQFVAVSMDALQVIIDKGA